VSAKRVSRAPGEPSPHQEPTEIRRTFARNLRQARETAGLSQYALAKAASCDRRQVRNIEVDAANTTLDMITRLAKPLGLAEIDLLLPSMGTGTAKRGSRVPAEPLSKTEPTEFRRRFAHNLRQAREAAGMPQRVLARAVAISLSGVWEIEVKAINVTLDTITLLAKQLGCTEIDLLRPKDP
jgi:ribosome-binding protein aMBF1 (putative translation factor)